MALVEVALSLVVALDVLALLEMGRALSVVLVEEVALGILAGVLAMGRMVAAVALGEDAVRTEPTQQSLLPLSKATPTHPLGLGVITLFLSPRVYRLFVRHLMAKIMVLSPPRIPTMLGAQAGITLASGTEHARPVELQANAQLQLPIAVRLGLALALKSPRNLVAMLLLGTTTLLLLHLHPLGERPSPKTD